MHILYNKKISISSLNASFEVFREFVQSLKSVQFSNFFND